MPRFYYLRFEPNKRWSNAMKGARLKKRCVMTLDTLARSGTRGMNGDSENADGKKPVRNLSNTIFTIGKSIRAFRSILDAGAL